MSDRSSSPVPVISEEVLHAMDGILNESEEVDYGLKIPQMWDQKPNNVILHICEHLDISPSSGTIAPLIEPNSPNIINNNKPDLVHVQRLSPVLVISKGELPDMNNILNETEEVDNEPQTNSYNAKNEPQDEGSNNLFSSINETLPSGIFPLDVTIAPLGKANSPNYITEYNSDIVSVQIEDFNSDDSLEDLNYEGISDSDSTVGSPVAKKFKKNNKSCKPILVARNISSPIPSTNPVSLSTPTNNIDVMENTPPSRKRKRNVGNWASTVRNLNRQKGKSYVDIKGNIRPAKEMKHIECSCVFRCNNNFQAVEKQKIHDAFWMLDDKSKNFFYSKYVKKVPAKRISRREPTKKSENIYHYFFQKENEPIRVCKKMFLSTLDISSRRLQWFFGHKLDETTGIPFSPKKGKHVKRKTPDSKIEEIKKHIESFPRVESHYCRENTQKKYLDSNLSIQKMYYLYKESCELSPVKKNIYTKVFNESFNCAFHLPKKDQCDLCTLFKRQTNLSDADRNKYLQHEKNKISAKIERDTDRKNRDAETAIITYDLQNVFALPKAEVSNFYYKRKFAVYNLTGHCNLNKVTYCSIWTEAQSGRSGNDLASALFKILNAVIQDQPNVKKIILWSDSCVAQNKNRVNTTMIIKFLQDHPTIQCVIHKYSEPGHSQLQEVDAVHSAIERHLRGITIYSPVSLLKQLKKLNYENVHLRIMQMKDGDFFNFNLASRIFVNMIPFMQARLIKYQSNEIGTLFFKTNLAETEPFDTVVLNKHVNEKRLKIVLKPLIFNWILSDEKKKDIQSMTRYMDKIDEEYYNAVLSKHDLSTNKQNATNASGEMNKTKAEVVTKVTMKRTTEEVADKTPLKTKSTKATKCTKIKTEKLAKVTAISKNCITINNKTKTATKATATKATAKNKTPTACGTKRPKVSSTRRGVNV